MPRESVAELLAEQAPACERLGSHVYAALLAHAADDVRAGGPAWAVLEPHATPDRGSALALRFMAAVHRLVLTGAVPTLAEYYPSAGGTPWMPDVWWAFRDVLEAHRDELVELVGRPCQTNEVGRCAGLLGGFLLVAKEHGLPLRCLEIGTSAGLNLRWDQFRYEGEDGRGWGPERSLVNLRGQWDVPVADLPATVEVAERSGCDPSPVDPRSEEGRLTLKASVWGDQYERFGRLNGALELANWVPATVSRAPMRDWLPGKLAEPVPGAATVVFHSVVVQYLTPAERDALSGIMAAAGERADDRSPLAWLRFEPERPLRAMTVRLTTWPGGEERELASAGAHGFPVRWR